MPQNPTLAETAIRSAPSGDRWTLTREQLSIRTREHLQLIDITEQVQAAVRRSGVAHGLCHLQTLHTTTGLIVNENEPLLLEDLKRTLRRWAPRGAAYRHDDLTIRRVNLVPGERANGHSHARAMLLGTSETLHVADGTLLLGRWQRILFVELDGSRLRTVSVVVTGQQVEQAESKAV